jgi:hypothetical protein
LAQKLWLLAQKNLYDKKASRKLSPLVQPENPNLNTQDECLFDDDILDDNGLPTLFDSEFDSLEGQEYEDLLDEIEREEEEEARYALDHDLLFSDDYHCDQYHATYEDYKIESLLDDEYLTVKDSDMLFSEDQDTPETDSSQMLDDFDMEFSQQHDDNIVNYNIIYNAATDFMEDNELRKQRDIDAGNNDILSDL